MNCIGNGKRVVLMYKFILKEPYDDIYDIYKDNERIRDENNFCVKIDERNKSVAFFNAWNAHKIANVNDIIEQLLELLNLMETSNWKVIKGYDDYVINIALRKKLEQ